MSDMRIDEDACNDCNAMMHRAKAKWNKYCFRIVKVRILEYADDFQEFAVHICNQAAETILNGLDFQLRTKIIQKDYSTIY